MNTTKRLVVMLALLVLAAFAVACSDSGETDNPGDGTCTSACPEGTICKDGSCIEPPVQDGDIPPDGDNPQDGDIPQDGDTTVDGDTPDGDVENDGDLDIDGDSVDGDIDFDIGDPDIEHDFTMTNCDYNPSLGAPDIAATPNQVDFGAVPIGSSHEESVTVCNAGSEDLVLTSVQFGAETSREFLKFSSPVPITIPAGKAVPIYLLYFPRDNNKDSGTLIILSNDSDEPSTHISLVSDIKPAPLLQITPQVVQFLGAQAGDRVSKQVEIMNVGLASTSIQELRIFSANSPYAVTAVDKPGTTASTTGPWGLAPDEFILVTVTMTMGEQARDDEMIVVWTVDVETRESRVQLTTANMDLCAVPNAGQDQVVRPLDTVMLDGTLSYDPNGVVTEYLWEWRAIPDGATRVVLLDSQGNEIQGLWTPEARPHFYAELAGAYELALAVNDSSPECVGVNQDTVIVNAVPDETIHIQLLWSDPGNDFDLHLIKPNGYHSRNCGAAENDTDCCWSNCDTDMGREEPCPDRGCPGPTDSPNWSSQDSRDDDPTLDIDDREGRGPENINLSLPEVGDYNVTVENYNGSETALIIVRVFLYGALRSTFYYGKPYTPTGIPKHYHWNVCTLRVVDASTIQIIPITENVIELTPNEE
jgi:hypothetical protein